MERKTLSKTLSLTLLSLLLIIVYAPIATAHNAPFPVTYDPTHFIIDTVSEPESLDPAWAYDTVSCEVIQNVYEPLIFFDVKYEDGPYLAGKVDSFVPKLADLPYPIDWSTVIERFDPPYPVNPKSGLPICSTWTFPIRTGVLFHDGLTLTPADVEYSFERGLVQDRYAGPQWLLYQPLLGVFEASSPSGDPEFGLKIDGAIESDATHVWFNLATAYSDLLFKQTLSQTWSSVVEKAWCQARGDLNVESVPGGWSNWAQIYNTWYNPAMSFIDYDMMGTGPYKFDYWDQGVSYSVIKYDAYWDGWPARIAPGSVERLSGFLGRVTWYYLPNWDTSKARFLAGDSDTTYVPRQYRDEILGQIVGGEKIRCYYPLPSLSLTAYFFTFNIATTSDFMGVPHPPGTFSTAGIPPDIFSDINVRKGFAYAFDYAEWINQVYLGEGEQPADPVVKGIAYDNVVNTKYVYDMEKAKYHLKLAWGGIDGNNDGDMEDPEDSPGALWNGGMKFTIPYSGTSRRLAAQEIATNVNSLNPTEFFIDTLAVNYYTVYVPAWVAQEIPIFIHTWLADNAGPHNMVFAFMHSYGNFAPSQGYSDTRVDQLIEAGILTPDDTTPYNAELDKATYDELKAAFDSWPSIPPDTRWPRRSIYYELQAIYHEHAASVPLGQPSGRHWEQAWMRGWYYNPLYPGEYVYHRWKALTHFGDVNNDGMVGIYDIAQVNSHWYPGPPPGPAGYSPNADIDGGTGATTGSQYGPVAGIPDGKVNAIDRELIKAQWDGPPQGPAHGGPSPVHLHDVAVTSVTPSDTVVRAGLLLPIDVNVENHGRNTETFDVTVYANLASIGSQSVTLASGELATITIIWDTTGVAKGDYSMSAYATPVPLEDDLADNTYADGVVMVLYPGDVNEDGVVNIIDVTLVSAHWYPGPPLGPLGYDPLYDIDRDGKINILELSIISAYWTGPPKGPLDP